MAQGECTITPKSPSSLSAGGGKIEHNTKNVEIECTCVNRRGITQRNANWFSPANMRILKGKSPVPSGIPYSLSINSNKATVLVIPNFNDVFNGTYTCSTASTLPSNSVMASIDCK